MAINTTEPTAFTAGDTVAWTRALADYPASAGWVLSYTFINASAKFSATGTATGDDHAITLSAAATAEFAAGDYAWQSRVTKGAESYTLATGRTIVKPSFAALATLDSRSPARRALEAMESAYIAYLSNSQGHVAEYEIAGRRMKFRNAAEIWQQIEKLRAEVAKEDDAARLAAGLKPRRRLLVRFNSP